MGKQTVIGVSHSCSLEQSCTGTECTGPFLFQMGLAYLVLAAIQLNMINNFLTTILILLCTQCTHYYNTDFYKNKTHKLLIWILKLFILKMTWVCNLAIFSMLWVCVHQCNFHSILENGISWVFHLLNMTCIIHTLMLKNLQAPDFCSTWRVWCLSLMPL